MVGFTRVFGRISENTGKVFFSIFSKFVLSVFGKEVFVYVSRFRGSRVGVPSRAVRRRVLIIRKKLRGVLSRGLSVLKNSLEISYFMTGLDVAFALSSRRDYRPIFFLVANAPSVVGKRHKGHFYRLSGKLS